LPDGGEAGGQQHVVTDTTQIEEPAMYHGARTALLLAEYRNQVEREHARLARRARDDNDELRTEAVAREPRFASLRRLVRRRPAADAWI